MQNLQFEGASYIRLLCFAKCMIIPRNDCPQENFTFCIME